MDCMYLEASQLNDNYAEATELCHKLFRFLACPSLKLLCFPLAVFLS